MKRFILLIIIMCITLAGCQTIEKEEKVDVNATVTEMEYQKPYTELRFADEKTLIPVEHSARYFITVSYEDVSETFDDEDLYKSVKEGDTIKMILCKGYDKDGNLIKQTLQLPE